VTHLILQFAFFNFPLRTALAAVMYFNFSIDFRAFSKIPHRSAKDSSGFFKDSKDFSAGRKGENDHEPGEPRNTRTKRNCTVDG